MKMRRAAFTLIELLVVIVIIGVLAALLFSGIAAAQRMAKRTQARTEVQGLATALEQYYSEYHRWPPTAVTTVPDPEATEVRINGDVAKLLQGDVSSAALLAANPRKMPFFQFRIFADPPANTQPVNPWWKSGVPTTNNWYSYKVDKDFNNVISAGASPPPTTALKRRVLVWTRNVDSGSLVTSAD